MKINHDSYYMSPVHLIAIFALFCMSVSTIAKAKEVEMDLYKKENYLFIPWGKSKGEIPLFEERRKYLNKDEYYWRRSGPKGFRVDENGNIYIYFNVGNKTDAGIKKFDPGNHEIGFLPLDPGKYGDLLASGGKMETQGNQVIIGNIFENKIDLYDESLRLKKEITIPRDELTLDNGSIYGGALHRHFQKKNKENTFVFDPEYWKKKGEPKDWHGARRNVVAKLVKKDGVNKVYVSGLESLGGTKKSILVWQENEELLYPTILQVDDEKNVYIRLYIKANRDWDSRVIKLGLNGDVKFQFDINPKFSMNYPGGYVPLEVTPDGNIYFFEGSPTGLYVMRLKYSKK